MRVEKRKTKRCNAVRYVAASIVTVLLVGGLVFVGNEEARASKVGVEIQEWLSNAFVVENDTGEDSTKDILFEEKRLGYLPEGFEKVLEEVTFDDAYYKYQNNVEDYIILHVYKEKTAVGVDNKEITQEVALNADGFEYRFIITEDAKTNGVVWIDNDNKFYSLTSTLTKEEIINIMNGISY